MRNRIYTEDELRYKAEAYCAQAERCESEVARKLRLWGSSEESLSSIMAHLYKENYLDTDRYCRAFVRDKYRLAHWGSTKIAQALRLKQLPAAAITDALTEIEKEEYDHILLRLLEQKKKSIKARNEYERNTKLIRFALGRGYQMRDILKYIDYDGPEETMD